MTCPQIWDIFQNPYLLKTSFNPNWSTFKLEGKVKPRKVIYSKPQQLALYTNSTTIKFNNSLIVLNHANNILPPPL